MTNANIAQYGRSFDFSSIAPVHLTPVAGTAQLEASPADGYYKFNINPFRTYLFTSKAEFKVNKDLTVSAEPYYWSGYGTGGGQLQLLTEGGTGTMATRVRDINGDGDTLDKVLTYGSSVTETSRPGVTFKANYRIDNHNINATKRMFSHTEKSFNGGRARHVQPLANRDTASVSDYFHSVCGFAL